MLLLLSVSSLYMTTKKQIPFVEPISTKGICFEAISGYLEGLKSWLSRTLSQRIPTRL
jgi:hypothetical protein